jgi:hypothetical protein
MEPLLDQKEGITAARDDLKETAKPTRVLKSSWNVTVGITSFAIIGVIVIIVMNSIHVAEGTIPNNVNYSPINVWPMPLNVTIPSNVLGPRGLSEMFEIVTESCEDSRIVYVSLFWYTLSSPSNTHTHTHTFEQIPSSRNSGVGNNI